MDISTMYETMISLHKKFDKEVEKLDLLHPDIDCDIQFLRLYIKAYEYWRVYVNMPENNMFKPHFLTLCADIIKKIMEVM